MERKGHPCIKRPTASSHSSLPLTEIVYFNISSAVPMGLSLEFSMPLVPHRLEQNETNKNKQAGADEKELYSAVGLPL